MITATYVRENSDISYAVARDLLHQVREQIAMEGGAS